MDTLAKTLLTTTIARLTATLSLADKIQDIDAIHQEIVGKLDKAIAALGKALASINALVS